MCCFHYCVYHIMHHITIMLGEKSWCSGWLVREAIHTKLHPEKAQLLPKHVMEALYPLLKEKGVVNSLRGQDCPLPLRQQSFTYAIIYMAEIVFYMYVFCLCICTSYSYSSFCHSCCLGLDCVACLVSYPLEWSSPLSLACAA